MRKSIPLNRKMIKGVGVDIVKVDRITDAIITKILSKKELEYLSKVSSEKRRKEFVAGRLAVKEAIIKAFKTPIDLKRVTILKDDNQAPYLDGASYGYLNIKFGKNTIHISLSHEEDYAVGMVVLE